MQDDVRMQTALGEIESELALLAKDIPREKADERAFFMKTKMPLLGLTLPQQRRRLKKGYLFSSLSAKEQIEMWDYVWRQAKTHEAKMQATLWIEELPLADDPVWYWQKLAPWVEQVNCWDQSDCLSRVYSILRELASEVVEPVLKQWNKSNNPWERRQSLVALLFYKRFRTTYPDLDFVLSLVKARLDDPDYYVQKGVGWCLREAWQVWPDEVYVFLCHHAAALAPAAWQAATEKLSPLDKNVLKGLRKSGLGRPG